MDLGALYQIVTASQPADWYPLSGAPATFLEQSVVQTGSDGTPRLEIESHFARATYRSDVSLGLAWGLPYEHGETWEEDWAAFPDKKIRGYWADVLWNGAPLDRVLLLLVDGGRAYLPSPPRGSMSVHRLNYSVARLVDALSGRPTEFDSYFTRSGMEVVEQHAAQ
jgi:hypothetical protein